jgi:DNA topoisomerase-1
VTAPHPRPPGITRRATGRRTPRFEYLSPDGRVITDAANLDRIAALAVPPAWTAVWIAADPDAKVQAVGVDGGGRTQYRYSPTWTLLRSREKFAHIPDFAGALPRLRAHVAATLRPHHAPLDRDRVLSAAVRLLDLGFFRVGSERYARDNETYGLTTLERRHVRVHGPVLHFDYTAKEHLHRIVEVTDPVVARWVSALIDRPDPDAAFLAWQLPAGGWQRVHSSHVNAFVHTATGIDATAKQFRTWAGTVLAAAALGGARHDEKARSPVLAAVRATSKLLGNTPAVARSAYIHPGVLDAFADGRTAEPAVRAAAARLGDDRLTTLWRDPGVQDATMDLIGGTGHRIAR